MDWVGIGLSGGGSCGNQNNLTGSINVKEFFLFKFPALLIHFMINAFSHFYACNAI